MFESRRHWPPGAFTLAAAETIPEPPGSGPHIDELPALIESAGDVETNADPDLAALTRLNAGSSLGGARPKVLVHDDDCAWIAKLNASNDPFNHVRVEHACLQLARACGLNAADSRIVEINNHDALLVKRFDIDATGARIPLHSANSFLKDPTTQQDAQHASYNNLIELIRRHSQRVTADLQQLAAQMLFNNCINNRDDHLRNFSFLGAGTNLALSPAYDLVPSDALGAYPQLGFSRQVILPSLVDSDVLRDAFKLTAKELNNVIETLRTGLQNRESAYAQSELSEADLRLLDRLIQFR